MNREASAKFHARLYDIRDNYYRVLLRRIHNAKSGAERDALQRGVAESLRKGRAEGRT